MNLRITPRPAVVNWPVPPVDPVHPLTPKAGNPLPLIDAIQRRQAGWDEQTSEETNVASTLPSLASVQVSYPTVRRLRALLADLPEDMHAELKLKKDASGKKVADLQLQQRKVKERTQREQQRKNAQDRALNSTLRKFAPQIRPIVQKKAPPFSTPTSSDVSAVTTGKVVVPSVIRAPLQITLNRSHRLQLQFMSVSKEQNQKRNSNRTGVEEQHFSLQNGKPQRFSRVQSGQNAFFQNDVTRVWRETDAVSAA